MRLLKRALEAWGVGVLVLLALPAGAATYVFNFDLVFWGPPPESPQKPWVVATVQDLDGGGVRMTIQNSADLGTQVVQRVFFNLNPVLNPASLSFNLVGSSGGFNIPSIAKAVDAYKPDGDGLYDIKIEFDSPWSDDPAQYLPDCFSAGEWITYEITGIPGLAASDFWYMSAPVPDALGPYYAAAYIPCQTWIAVPEPQPFLLAGLGMCIWLGRKLLRRQG